VGGIDGLYELKGRGDIEDGGKKVFETMRGITYGIIHEEEKDP